MTVGQLLAAATSRELTEWEAEYSLEYEEASECELHQGLAARARAELESIRRR
jgi:hypothetical protein